MVRDSRETDAATNFSAVLSNGQALIGLGARSGRHYGDWLLCERALWIGAGPLQTRYAIFSDLDRLSIYSFEMTSLNARKNGVPFGWIGMDCFYGEQPWLRQKLDAEGLVFIADIPRDTRVWLSPPKTGIPERDGKQGRHPIRERVLDGESLPIEVQKIREQIETAQWRQVTVRDTERKELKIDIACLRVYPVENKLPGKELWLIIRKEVGQGTVKYQLSNAAPDSDILKLAKMSCSRYWIERAIEDAKGVASLEDYEARSWRSWHHHIAMSLLAMLAVLMMQIELKVKADMLTLQDVKDILEVIMPKRDISEREILKIIKAKHKARISARESHHRRQTAASAG